MSASNEAASERLAALLARLSDDDLRADLGGGWTVTTALGHLAFWDRKQRQTIDVWGHAGPALLEDDWVNAALEPILTAMQPRAAAELAVREARDLDAAIAGAPEAVRAAIVASGHGYIVERFPHRDEHCDQIEASLG